MGDRQGYGCGGGRGTGEVVLVRPDEGGARFGDETAELDAYREDVDSMACMMSMDIWGFVLGGMVFMNARFMEDSGLRCMVQARQVTADEGGQYVRSFPQSRHIYRV